MRPDSMHYGQLDRPLCFSFVSIPQAPASKPDSVSGPTPHPTLKLFTTISKFSLVIHELNTITALVGSAFGHTGHY